MEIQNPTLNAAEKRYSIKHGFEMTVDRSGVPKTQIFSEKGKLIYQAVLNSAEARKKSNKWLSLNTVLFDHLCGFAHSNQEADELIEKKLTEFWGNPAFSNLI